MGFTQAYQEKKLIFCLTNLKIKIFLFSRNNYQILIVEKISPISKEIKKLNQDPSYIDQVLQDGSEKAYELSSKKIKDIKKKFGF